MTAVVLYTRPGCHLCDEARDLILALRESDVDFELREIDIDTDDELHSRYLERIPVVEVDGKVVAELHVEPDALGQALGLRGTGTVRSMIEDPGPKHR